MRIAALVARLLLGLMFLVFGLNGFLHFIPQPPQHGAAGEFVDIMRSTGFYVLVFGVQTLCGIAFLADRFVPLALVLIAPVIANILVFHVTMDPAGIAPGVVALVLWLVVALWHREHFDGLLRATRRAA